MGLALTIEKMMNGSNTSDATGVRNEGDWTGLTVVTEVACVSAGAEGAGAGAGAGVGLSAGALTGSKSSPVLGASGKTPCGASSESAGSGVSGRRRDCGVMPFSGNALARGVWSVSMGSSSGFKRMGGSAANPLTVALCVATRIAALSTGARHPGPCNCCNAEEKY